MGQIVGGAAKPKRCNLNKLSQLGTPAAGEYILVSSDNSMNAAGQGIFDAYVMGDGHTAAEALELKSLRDVQLIEEVSQLGKKVDGLDYTEVTGKYIRPDGAIGNSAVGFYTSPIPVKAGETLTYSIAGFGCAILSTYENGVYTPVVIAPSRQTQYTNETYTATEDCYVVFCGTPGTLEVSSSMNNFDRLQLQINETNNELSQVRDEVEEIESSSVPFTEVTGKYIKQDGTIGNSSNGFYSFPILVSAGETLTYSITGAACAILSKYDNGSFIPIVVTPGSGPTQYTNQTYTATEDCYVVFSGTPGTLDVVCSNRIERLQLQVDNNTDELTKVPFTEVTGKYIKPDGTIADSAVGFYSSPIFVPKGLTITYSIAGYGCAILSIVANNIYTPIVVAPGSLTFFNDTFTATDDCYVAFSGTPGTLLVSTSRLDSLEARVQSIRTASDGEFYETIKSGEITTEGKIQFGNKNYCLFLIPGGHGFYLELNDGYVVDSSHLFDEATSTLIQSNFVGSGSWVPLNFGGRAIYGQDTTICGQFLAVIIKKSDNTTFGADELESVIKEYGRLDNPHLHRWIISEPYFQYAHKRMRAITNIQWLCKEKVQAVTTAYNNVRFLRGEHYNGVPYSDVSEKNKYVGVYVTPYTFLTAAANKRSLVYTENLFDRTSGYGITYDSSVRVVGCYYGSVCSGFTAAIMGLPLVYLVSNYAPGGKVPNLTTVQSADDIQPLDLIYYSGHISIVSDIYKDDYGKIKYILWAEYNYPNVFIDVYTMDTFKERLTANNAVIQRYSAWEDTCTDIEIPNEIPAGVFDYARPLLKDSDIYVFAGDKACFSIDDPIYLNLNREKGYTNLLVYKDDIQTPLLNVDISQLAADNMYEGEDWVKYDLRSHDLGVGKFRAILYDGSNYSDNAYFEIIDTAATLAISNSRVNSVSFSASNCVPIAVMSSSTYYYTNSIKIFSNQEIEAGTATLNWAIDSNYPYITILFKGDYGVAQKRFNVAE